MVIDFREELCLQQVSENEFSYCWVQIDTATEKIKDFDCKKSCTYEEMMNAVCSYAFDATTVHNHFIDNPCDSITLIDEY